MLSRISTNGFGRFLPAKSLLKIEKKQNHWNCSFNLTKEIGKKFQEQFQHHHYNIGRGRNENYLLDTKIYYKCLQNKRQRSFSSSTSSNGKENLFQTLLRNLFGKYLIVTNTIGSGILMVFGDIIAQTIEMNNLNVTLEENQNKSKMEKSNQIIEKKILFNKNSSAFPIAVFLEYDHLRICRMFIVGAIQGPMHHYIYTWMEKLMPVANVRNTLYKILIDQILLSPLCIIIFFFSACALENKNYNETYKELKQKFLYIYCVDWCVWPVVQYVNFRYLELKYRVTYVNVCTAIYNIFMSYMKHND